MPVSISKPISKFFVSFLLFCATLALPVPTDAQQTGNGTISGIIVAPDGVPLTAAEIVLSSLDGAVRSTSTSTDGTFSLKDLPSGSYTLKAASPGFVPYTQSSIAIATGRTTHLSIKLAIATAQQTVSVTASPTAFDTSQTSSVINIDRDRIEELPMPSRNYLTFVLLSPQVSAANPALQQQSVAQSTGNFSFGGLRPGSNAVYLDGVNDNDEYSGGSRTQLSPEAISDFQIINHGFAAESGGGAGGSIDVQTRTGINHHGDAFLFVQNGALNATPPLGRYPRKPDENRLRAGVSLGGPIQRDKTFYYLAAEQELSHGEDVNDLSLTTLSTINSALRQVGPLSNLTLQPGFLPTTDQETELSGRADHSLTTKHGLMFRYAFTNTRNVNDAFHTDEVTDRTARGSSFIADNSLNATLTSAFTENTLNKLNFEFAQRRAVQRTGTSTGPGVLISGVALFGTPYSGNGRRYETHVEFADTVSLQRPHHLIQLGGRADRVALRASIADGSQGFFVFPTLASLQTGDADFFVQSFGNFDTNFTAPRLSGFVQDHWTALPNLTLDYGLRYEYNRLPSTLPQDPINFSPRFGLAWTPRNSLVIRSGFGIFFDRFQLSTINRILQKDGTHGFEQIVEDASAAKLYRSGSIPPAPLPNIAPSIWKPQSNLVNPYSEVTSLSAEQALPLQTILTAEYQFVRGVHLGRSSNINLTAPVVLTQQNAASLDVSAPQPQQLGRLVFSPLRNDPRFDAINLFATTASSTYHGATITLNRQFTDDFQILAGYTFSKTVDDASSDTGQPQNPFALDQERSLSLQDQRHRLTLSGLWLIGPDLNDPQDAAANANPGPLMRALTGFEIAPILTISSGFRANPITGTDSNREHIFPFAARPSGYARNSLSTSLNINFDLRLLRMIPLGQGHLDVVAESFNLLNHRNVSLLNTTFGLGLQPTGSFSTPTATSTARRIQFSLDYEF